MVNPATRSLVSNLYHVGRHFFSNYLQDDRAHGTETSSIQSQSTEYLVRNWLEASFAWFQMAILWHDPFVSVCGLSGFFSLFLLLTHFAPRFYATILMAIFCYNLTIVWFRHIWPEIRVPPEETREEESRLDVDRWTHLHPQLMTINEFNRLTNNLMNAIGSHIQRLLKYRREEPLKFCLLVCSILSCTAIIGNIITGPDLILYITTSLLIGPGIYLHLLPSSVKEYLSNYIFVNNNSSSNSNQSITPTKQALGTESSASPSSTSTPLSLFDQLKQNSSFLLGQESTKGMRRNDNKLEPVQMDVPTTKDKIVPQEATSEIISKDKLYEDKPKSSDEMSSNESTSLIDFEDDQQDDFVIL